MTEQEFLRYKGLKTKGSHGGCNFEGGVVVGYRKNHKPTEFQSLIAFFNDDRGWDKADRSEVIFLDDNGFFFGSLPNGTFLYVSLENLVFETEKEKKELDLAEILDGCKGVELWSDMFGKCKLSRIDPELTYQIKVETFKSNGKGCEQCFSKQGKWNVDYPEGKCMLWPSETNRDWATFKKPTNIKEGDWVVCGWSVRDVVIRRYFKDDKCFNVDFSLTLEWAFIAPFEKYDPTLSDDELLKLSIV
jgi:hypothetical protein